MSGAALQKTGYEGQHTRKRAYLYVYNCLYHCIASHCVHGRESGMEYITGFLVHL